MVAHKERKRIVENNLRTIIVQEKGGESVATRSIFEKAIPVEKVRLENYGTLKEGKVVLK